ncbi:hypothetical protein BJV78DRAFT_1154643 [Lactifluus subvellereus]|nr:hypothetical protein BJV78DRAFT_1154643 [Lactifluus subvellereus]
MAIYIDKLFGASQYLLYLLAVTSTEEDPVTAGYTLGEYQRNSRYWLLWSDERLTKAQTHDASSDLTKCISVVLKIIGDSNECRLLQYLSGIKVPSNHTIPLPGLIGLSIGKTTTVLPWKSLLDEVLQFRDRPDDVPGFGLYHWVRPSLNPSSEAIHGGVPHQPPTVVSRSRQTGEAKIDDEQSRRCFRLMSGINDYVPGFEVTATPPDEGTFEDDLHKSSG